MKNLLITGATGFVGSHLAEEAIQRGYQVHATVRRDSGYDHLDHLPISYHKLSLFDENALSELIENHNIRWVIHNAGLTKAIKSQDYYSVNAHSTHILTRAIERAKVENEKFIFMSSLAAQGPANLPGQWLKTDLTEQPVTDYGYSKLKAEQYVKQIEGLNYIILRPTGVFGPMEKDFLQVVKMINRGLDLYIGKFDQSLSFIYVKDLARLVITSLESGVSQKTYNVSDGYMYTRFDFSEEVARILKKKAFRIFLPLWVGKSLASASEWICRIQQQPSLLNRDKLNEILAPSWACDIADLKRDFNFVPQYNLASGLIETISWYQERRWL